MKNLVAVFPEKENCVATIINNGHGIYFCNGKLVFPSFRFLPDQHTIKFPKKIKSIYAVEAAVETVFTETAFERGLFLLAEDGDIFLLCEHALTAVAIAEKLGLSIENLMMQIGQLGCYKIVTPSRIKILDMAISDNLVIILDTEGRIYLNNAAKEDCKSLAISATFIPMCYFWLIHLLQDPANPFGSVTIGNGVFAASKKETNELIIFEKTACTFPSARSISRQGSPVLTRSRSASGISGFSEGASCLSTLSFNGSDS